MAERIPLRRPEDLTAVLPDHLPEPFTTADLAARLHRPRRTAQQVTYCLRRLGLIELIEPRRRAAEYRIVGRAKMPAVTEQTAPRIGGAP